jgi:hypothetical protein
VEAGGEGGGGVRVGDEERRQADAGQQSQPLPTHVDKAPGTSGAR